MSDKRRRRLRPSGGSSGEENASSLSESDHEYESAADESASEGENEAGAAREKPDDAKDNPANEGAEEEKGEREAGDGQEERNDGKVDDDEDRKNPQYIPKKGMFYEHDDRIDTDEEGEKQDTEKAPLRRLAKSEATGRWGHDKFSEREQVPKSKEELVSTYGYDIRDEDSAPRARRRRRYGRGPNKYTRNWEDGEAYGAPKGPRRPDEIPAMSRNENTGFRRGRGGRRGRGSNRTGSPSSSQRIQKQAKELQPQAAEPPAAIDGKLEEDFERKVAVVVEHEAVSSPATAPKRYSNQRQPRSNGSRPPQQQQQQPQQQPVPHQQRVGGYNNGDYGGQPCANGPPARGGPAFMPSAGSTAALGFIDHAGIVSYAPPVGYTPVTMAVPMVPVPVTASPVLPAATVEPPGDRAAVLLGAAGPGFAGQTVPGSNPMAGVLPPAAMAAGGPTPVTTDQVLLAAAASGQGYASVRGGVTYFNPTAQAPVMTRPVNKRPKAAIPIVDPSAMCAKSESANIVANSEPATNKATMAT